MAENESSLSKRGGWICFPFIIGVTALLMLASAGCVMNLIVYLIEQFYISSIDAAQIYSILSGSSNLLPIVAAIIADSFMGCYLVASISSFICLLGIVLQSLTAVIAALRPQPCLSPPCPATVSSPSKAQLAVLYTALALSAVGSAGFKFTLATMGANQFHRPDHQATFFNWFVIAQYVGFILSFTVLVYVQDNVSWGLGFFLCATANLVGTAVLVLGSRFYHHEKPEGSPFTGLARVVVAAIKKRKLSLTSNPEDYYHGPSPRAARMPDKSFRFFNLAALRIDRGITSGGDSVEKPWNLCTVQQVEDFKTIIRVLPLWSTSILLSTPLAIQSSVTVLQALTMDRRLGPRFKIPAGSVLVLVMISGSISVILIDRVLNPLCRKIRVNNAKKKGSPSSVKPLRRIGVGHVLTVFGMVISALVESKRLHSAGKISVLWLFPQLILVGLGEGFHYPGQVALYYQEFPTALKSSSTAMIAMIIGISFYLSSAVIDAAQRLGWWKDDINNGRLDLVYWMLALIGILNFGYYLICAGLYRYRLPEDEEDISKSKLPIGGEPI